MRNPSSPYAANVGKRTQMANALQAGVYQTSQTQLITHRVNEPVQWVVTLAQATRTGGGTPWTSTFDGGAYPPVGAAVSTAPYFAAAARSWPQVNLRWGAGGASYAAIFDYPVAGGAFDVVADTVDLSVVAQTYPSYAAQADVPVVGAFMVPGQASIAAPLRWVDVGAGIANLQERAWAVKPYARQVRLSCPNIGNGRFYVSWRDYNNIEVWQESYYAQATPELGRVITVPVIPGAVVMVIGNETFAGTAQFYVCWEIGLT